MWHANSSFLRKARKISTGLAIALFSGCIFGRVPVGLIIENRSNTSLMVDVNYPQSAQQHYTVPIGQQAMVLRQYASGCLIREPDFAKDEVFVEVKTASGLSHKYNRSQLMQKMKWSSSAHTWSIALDSNSLQAFSPIAPLSVPASSPSPPDTSVIH